MSYRLSHINDAGAEFEEDAYFEEDTFTAGRPPQYNDNNQPPESMVPGAQGVVPRDDAVTTQDRDPSHIPGIADNYPASCHTDSTTTLIADEASAMTATTPTQACPGPRADILFLINRDYNVAVQPLTEGALAALNMDFSNSLYIGHVAEWIRSRSRFPPSDPMDLRMSVARRSRAGTAARTGSTVEPPPSVDPSTTLPSLRPEHVAGNVFAIGGLFADVSAPPTGYCLLDEDL